MMLSLRDVKSLAGELLQLHDNNSKVLDHFFVSHHFRAFFSPIVFRTIFYQMFRFFTINCLIIVDLDERSWRRDQRGVLVRKRESGWIGDSFGAAWSETIEGAHCQRKHFCFFIIFIKFIVKKSYSEKCLKHSYTIEKDWRRILAIFTYSPWRFVNILVFLLKLIQKVAIYSMFLVACNGSNNEQNQTDQ